LAGIHTASFSKKTCWSATEAKWEDKLILPEVNIARIPGDEQLIKLLKKRYPLPEYMRNQYISQKLPLWKFNLFCYIPLLSSDYFTALFGTDIIRVTNGHKRKIGNQLKYFIINCPVKSL
jgi:hypothetical protein